MSVEAVSYRAHAFVAAELAATHGKLTDDEARAKAQAMMNAALEYLQTHFGTHVAAITAQDVTHKLPIVLQPPERT